MTSGMGKGFMSLDLAVYFLELVLIAYYGLVSVSYVAGQGAENAASSAQLARLVAFSDYLVKYALAQEKNGILISHTVDEAKLAAIEGEMAHYETVVGSNLTAGKGPMVSISSNSMCVQRLVIVNGAITILGVCADA